MRSASGVRAACNGYVVRYVAMGAMHLTASVPTLDEANATLSFLAALPEVTGVAIVALADLFPVERPGVVSPVIAARSGQVVLDFGQKVETVVFEPFLARTMGFEFLHAAKQAGNHYRPQAKGA